MAEVTEGVDISEAAATSAEASMEEVAVTSAEVMG